MAKQQAEEETKPERQERKEAIVYVGEAIDQRISDFAGYYQGDERMVQRLKMVTLHALAHPKMRQKLSQSDLATVIEALHESCALGLMPIVSTSEGALVPYWNKDKGKYDIQFQPMYRGLLKLVYNSQHVAGAASEVVYEQDSFDYELGSAPYLRHRLAWQERGNRLGAYAIFYLRASSAPLIEIMPIAEIEKVRLSSKADKSSSPWTDWYDEMTKKTVLRRGMKDVPLDHLAERALQIENDAEERYSLPPLERAQLASGNGSAAERVRARLLEEPQVVPQATAPEEAEATAAVEATEAPRASEEAPRAVEPDIEQPTCGEPSPFGENDEPCRLEPDHGGKVHRSRNATWPVK